MSTLIKILLIGSGGFTGAVLRYLVSGMVHRLFSAATVFPVGTFVVNITGCLIIGILSGLTDTRQLFTAEIRLLIFIGLLGSFTTFSTFGIESLYLLQERQFLFFGIYALGQLVIGLVAVWSGYTLVK